MFTNAKEKIKSSLRDLLLTTGLSITTRWDVVNLLKEGEIDKKC